MTIRNLDRAFAPRSVAVIGASDVPGKVGALLFANVRRSFRGPIYAVNPKYSSLWGLPCYPEVRALPEVPDLCVIVTPPVSVPGLIESIGTAGSRAAVVITAGIDAQGKKAMMEAAGRHGVRIIGPNSIGFLAPNLGLNASFTHIDARPGSLALVSQSGAIVSSIIDWAEAEGIGFSQIVSVGDMLDVDIGDCLNMLAQDSATSAILLYVESISQARKFMSAARAASRIKPVIAVKPGRHAEAAQAAQTHTGALAGADGVVEAALQRAGVIRVGDLHDLFSAAEITARFGALTSGRVAIVTNGGGAGVLAVDHLLDRGAALASLCPETLASLNAILPPTWSHANPIDIIGDAPPKRYVGAIEAAVADPGVDLVWAMNCPTALAEPAAAAKAVAGKCEQGRIGGKPVMATWLGQHAAAEARRTLNAVGIASLDTPSEAAQAIGVLLDRQRLTDQLQRVPGTFETLHVDRASAAAVIKKVAAANRTMLTEVEAKAVLGSYGIAVPASVTVASADDVHQAAAGLLHEGGKLVVKMVSETLTHKSDLGGVIIGVPTADAAAEAARTIAERLRAKGLQHQLNGFVVQQMITRPNAHELLIGVADDPVFGPVLMFGAGGTAVEVIADTTMELLPVDDVLAQAMIGRTRISRLLAGYRDRPRADHGSIVNALKAVSQLLIDCPQIRALDINPLLVDEAGAIVLDARIELDLSRPPAGVANPALAIRPYPAAWAKSVDLDGERYDIRAIRPVDAALYPDFLAGISAEDMRLRFLVPTKDLPRETLIRLTQLDYDRDIAFVALDQGALAGIVRYAADPDRSKAEFGLMVRSDLQGKGLGKKLMEHLIAYGRAEKVGELFGSIMRENRRMLDLVQALGFSAEPGQTRDTVIVRLELAERC
ncbi:bifunctional acetate--CoA ligase family protein/GNAT family N-acetyltransferase [Devosia sp. PTR5]|uniref:Bifunctional acetate--CoA ligase family protein/GNAT family N-acetyltransferase n=1 Tax=Devosia oryzisoli TaxID=2774138 RepID=A0A927FT27_9HYPH|nr:bifunctional acetate--CoA ligase family protein/GNAT family N-acetyltransferase [Devosia oryzisoli]MBD8064423.1 bifunctional acetate--CoA ligase family protein/GNAT family N-acetyltransferase [Devosia oryzisoli]